MKYHLAGAYDSNIALLLTVGNTRMQSYQRLAEILRVTSLRGKDLATNLQFHYGLVNWFVGNNINARPSTGFIVPYLTAVGQLKESANQIDLTFAYNQLRSRYLANCSECNQEAYAATLDRKQTLLLRPLEMLFAEPHVLAGWLSLNGKNFRVEGEQICWLKNPLELLAELYHFLNMDYVTGKPAANIIWNHDDDLLQKALAFYRTLDERTKVTDFAELQALLAGGAPAGFDAQQWAAVQAAHIGFQTGTELLSALPFVALQTSFFDLTVNDDLSINIPDLLTDTELQGRMAKVLVPPPTAKSDEILAVSGGMFYPREAPGMPAFVEEGSHFNQGDPLYIVEVMKMFNKVYAPFCGTVVKVLTTVDGAIIKKGEPLFIIKPDEEVVVESPEVIKARMRERTADFIARI